MENERTLPIEDNDADINEGEGESDDAETTTRHQSSVERVTTLPGNGVGVGTAVSKLLGGLRVRSRRGIRGDHPRHTTEEVDSYGNDNDADAEIIEENAFVSVGEQQRHVSFRGDCDDVNDDHDHNSSSINRGNDGTSAATGNSKDSLVVNNGSVDPTLEALRLKTLSFSDIMKMAANKIPDTVINDRSSQVIALKQLFNNGVGGSGGARGGDEDNGGCDVDVPTVLHDLCARHEVTFAQLQTALARAPLSASVTDTLGRFPLHILADNVHLIATPVGKTTATEFAMSLLRVYPAAMTSVDAFGCVPFVRLLHDWESWMYCTSLKNKNNNRSISMFHPASRLMEKLAHAESQTGSSPHCLNESSRSVRSWREEEEEQQQEQDEEQDAEAVEEERHGGSTPSAVLNDEDAHEMDACTSRERTYPRVVLWEEVDWCFEMLSLVMDKLGGKSASIFQVVENSNEASSSTNNDRDDANLKARSFLAKHVPTKIPTIMKTILLIENVGSRKLLLDSSFVRAMLLQPETVGTWLTGMLRKSGIISQFAVDYLVMVSGVKIEDYAGPFRPLRQADREAFQVARLDVFNAIFLLDGAIASLATLDEEEIQRAVLTTVVSYMMTQSLVCPFVVSMSLIEFVLQIILLLAFRMEVSAPSLVTKIHVPTNIAYLICANFFLRKGSELVALASLSTTIVRSCMCEVGNIVQIMAYIMVLVTYSWRAAFPDTFRNGLNTFVLGLLWLNVLLFMKVVNKGMSLCITAIGNITMELFPFMIVLLIFVLMFSDMFRITITTKDNGNFCEDFSTLHNDTESYFVDGVVAVYDYCNPNFSYSLLRTYSMLLGDFEIDDYTVTPGMAILFVISTMIGVLVLLNVLLAVIYNGYDVAEANSTFLFRRTRINYIARNEILESFLKPGSLVAPSTLNAKKCVKAAFTGFALLRWCVLISVIVTAMYAEVFLVSQAIAHNSFWTVIFMSILVITLTCALWILIFFTGGGVCRAMAPGIVGSLFHCLDRMTGKSAKYMACILFGLPTDKDCFDSQKVVGKRQDAANEPLNLVQTQYIVDRVINQVGNRVRDELKVELTALENRLLEQQRMRVNDDTISLNDSIPSP